ncbi:hypothetical protein Ancab_013197, partial [Ancistrocladus abbreviatus]
KAFAQGAMAEAIHVVLGVLTERSCDSIDEFSMHLYLQQQRREVLTAAGNGSHGVCIGAAIQALESC